MNKRYIKGPFTAGMFQDISENCAETTIRPCRDKPGYWHVRTSLQDDGWMTLKYPETFY